jgi:hypothetical protein
MRVSAAEDSGNTPASKIKMLINGLILKKSMLFSSHLLCGFTFQ